MVHLTQYLGDEHVAKRFHRPRRAEVQRRAVAALAFGPIAPRKDPAVPRERQHVEVPTRQAAHREMV